MHIEPISDGGAGAVYRRMRALSSSAEEKGPDIACFVDHKNALAVYARGRTAESPIRTAVMELVRSYTKLRWDAARQGGTAPLHPKHCTLYTFSGPGRDALDVMAVGAIGSTLEGPVARPETYWRYFRPAQSAVALGEMLRSFPPLYRDVIRIHPAQVDPTTG